MNREGWLKQLEDWRRDAGLGRPTWYMLDAEHRVVAAEDWLEGARWCENGDNRRVAESCIGDIYDVSTVFLGIDHRHFGVGPPIVFETMVFKANDSVAGNRESLDDYTERYCTWDDAVAGHERITAQVRADLEKP